MKYVLSKIKEGVWITDPLSIKEEFMAYFMYLFTNNAHPIYNSNEFKDWAGPMNRITDTQCNLLLEPFTQEEIKEAMFSMKHIKSPWTNGIPPVFLQKHWHVLGEEMGQATKNFLEGWYMLKETNQTFIALIPKVERPEQVNQFRPISLCNSTYKFISKCMVRRLHPLMKYLIGKTKTLLCGVAP